MNFQAARDWLYTTQWHGIKPGLGTMERLLAALALRVSGESGGPQFLHVAGTNGKGSTCAMLASMLRASGRRTGLYTSPHLVSLRERIVVDGIQISEVEAAEGLTLLRQLTEGWQPAPTFFEILTALGFWYFQRAGAEWVVLETGLGGRLDATNIVTPRLSIITPIDADHEQWLGHTLTEIAGEKAGIIKPGRPVISAPQHPEVLAVLTNVARERNAPLHLVLSPLTHIPLALAGEHQRWNAALAVYALDAAELPVPSEEIAHGLATVQWPGRFQRVAGGSIVLDGAHNPAAARQLARTWQAEFRGARPTLIFGVMQDKDLSGLCEALAPLACRAICVAVRNPRSASALQVESALHGAAPELETHLASDLPAALAVASRFPERILIAGSLFLVGEALAHLQGESDREVSAQ